MIEHPSIRPPQPLEEQTPKPVEDTSWLDATEIELRSPRYWLCGQGKRSKVAPTSCWEAELDSLTPNPDRLSDGLVEVRECLPVHPRRHSQRLRAPQRLVLDTGMQQFARVEIHLLVSRHPTRFVECFLFDVNDHGIGLISPIPLPPGSTQVICAHHEEDPDPLLVAEVPVLSQRAYPAKLPRPERLADQPMWVHGMETEPRNARLLLKTTLDTLACLHAQRDRPATSAMS